ncbi:hypothetical protein MACK_001120 [Theileria orientalis]|uniref:Uncharacterized protein n=1 Tax=Theileria orientalis TaxID=68886 RepID=A0A976QT83_THEOR|nr:hypothetical protein MACK_001120 [Theileria orientalis]
MITRDIFLFLILCILPPGRHNFVESGRTTLGHTRNSGKKDSHFAHSKFTHRRPNDSNNRLKRNFEPQPKFYYSGYSDVDPAINFNYNLISLDITKPKSTKEFEYNYNPITGADIYELKRPNLLRKVTERERLLWESKHGKYSDKIIVFKDDNGENRLKVFIADDIKSKRDYRLAPPVRVPSIRRAALGKKDESRQKGYESEGKKDRFRESDEELGDRTRKHELPKGEYIEIPKKARDRRAAIRRREETSAMLKWQEEMRARLKRQEEEMRYRLKRLEARAREDRKHTRLKRYEYSHREDYKHPKLRHEGRPEPQGRPSTHSRKPEQDTPKELFLLFASQAPNEKKFDLLVNGETERYQFKSDSQCVRVKVDEQILWKHKRGHSFPTVLEYDKREGMILLEFPEFTDVYINAEGLWYYRV